MHAERGSTLVEVMTVTAVLTALSLMITQSIVDLSKTQAFTEGQARLGDIAERVMRGVEKDVTFSARVFTADADGQSYLGALDLDLATAAATGSKMPARTERGYFDKDPAGQVETGNQLLLGVADKSFTTDLAPAGSPPDEKRVDTLKLVAYYLVKRADGQLDLARWASVRMARYRDVAEIADSGQRIEVGLRLWQAGIRHAWDTVMPSTTGALYEILATGVLAPMLVNPNVPREPSECVAALLGSKRARVATNGSLQTIQVPAYAAADAVFPAGFEVKVDGPATGRLVLVRLALAAGAAGSRVNFAEMARLVSTRDG